MSYRVVKISKNQAREWIWVTLKGATDHATAIVHLSNPGDVVKVYERRPLKFWGFKLGGWWWEICHVDVQDVPLPEARVLH